MATVTIVDNTSTMQVVVEDSAMLLRALRKGQANFHSPCGGNGTCQKCTALVTHANGESEFVMTCMTQVRDGDTVRLDCSKQISVTRSGKESSYEAQPAEGLGVAIDIGTTTMAATLVDLATGKEIQTIGQSNPQGIFGADVISRLTACHDGYRESQEQLVCKAMADMINSLCQSRCRKAKDVTRISIAANTIMQCLATGYDPEPIGVAPFESPTYFGDMHTLTFGSLERECMLAPCISGYVGGDISAGMLCVDMHRSDKPVMLLDLGTNGEMAIGDSKKMVACATAAGPVFEGAGIACGMPAFDGAISAVRFVDGTIEYDLVGKDEPCGICGTGLIDAIALLLETGALDVSGYLNDADEVDGPIASYLGEHDGETCLYITPDVFVTQNDVRQFQLAMAAISAGIRVMIEEYGTTVDQVDHFYIAGGFGQHMNIENAARAGLFPAEFITCCESVGNSSLSGAKAMLVNEDAWDDCKAIGQNTQYVELSVCASFNDYYIEAMEFPE